MEMYSDTCESLAVRIVLPWKCIATRVNLCSADSVTMEICSDTCESLAVQIVLPWKCIATRVNLWKCRLCSHGNV
jgi:hypothetical protein